MAVQDLQRIEDKIDRVAAGAIAISDNVGGIAFQSMSELLEFAKLLSVAGTAMPKHLRGNPGACLAVTIQALEWRMSPVAVANQSYEVNDRIAYQSMLIHAVIEARAPLKERLRGKWEGEGAQRYCVVTGHLKGEIDPVEYRSPTVGNIKVKNSPLWQSDVDQQLWYFATRAWARRYCPDVLLGIYGEDELPQGPERAENITPKPDIGTRLKGAKGRRGFSADNTKALEHRPGEAMPPIDVKAKQPEAVLTTPAAEAVRPQSEAALPDSSAGLTASERADIQAEEDGAGILADEAAREEAEPDEVAENLERNLKRFAEVPHMLGLVALKSELAEYLKAQGRDDLLPRLNTAFLERQKIIGKLKK